MTSQGVFPALVPLCSRILTSAKWSATTSSARSPGRRKIYGRDGAAALLGLKPTTLAYRMKALGIAHPRS
jgi:hypothetical protein